MWRLILPVFCLIVAVATAEAAEDVPLSGISDSSTAAPSLPGDAACRWREVLPDGTRLPGRCMLVFTGDNLLAGRMGRGIEQHGVAYPYEYVADVLRQTDFAFGNLEAPITAYARATPGKSAASIAAHKNFIFKTAPRYSGEVLKAAGFDCVSLANNHTMDYCSQGVLDTLAALDAAGIAHAGAGHDASAAAQGCVVQAGEVRLGLLAYSLIVPAASRAGATTPGINALSKAFEPALRQAITRMHEQAEVVIVSFHWGQEGSRSAARYQRDIARACIDAGALLVIGHHPHVPQGVELYHGGVIAYSLGNFAFCGASAQVESMILRVELDGAQIAGVSLLPLWVRQGRPAPSADPRLAARLREICAPTGSVLTAAGDGAWLRVHSR